MGHKSKKGSLPVLCKNFKPDFLIDFSAVDVIGVSFVEDGKK